MRFKPLFLLLTVVLGVQATPHTAQAETAYDSLPPLNWDEMQSCELVVAAHYESHITSDAARDDPEVRSGLIRVQQQTLTLHVDRVLKGKTVKSGDSVNVELCHWYSIETYPTNNYGWAPRAKDDGIPRLCYQDQSGSGLLKPRQTVPDVRQDMLYFFPKASAPVLERAGQVQSLDLEKDWTLALHGYAASLPLRLLQGTSYGYFPNRLFPLTQERSEKIRESALNELDVMRDPATLNLLFDWLAMPYNRNGLAPASERALNAIGDQGGDVYNRALKRFLEAPPKQISYDELTPAEKEQYQRVQFNNEDGMQRYRAYARIMARVDGDRAAHDFERMITQKRPYMWGVAFDSLGSTDSDYALDYAFRLLRNPETVLYGTMAIRDLLSPGNRYNFDYLNYTPRTEHLRELAIPRLRDALQLPTFDASRTEAARAPNAPDNLSYLRLLRENLEEFLPHADPAPIDLAHAEQELLHPNIDPAKLIASPFDSDWTPVEKEGISTIVAIDNERDPRFIPLLVTLIQSESPWLKSRQGQQTVFNYAQMFPHTFKSELDKQGLTSSLLKPALQERGPIISTRLWSRPNTVWSLSKTDNPGPGVRAFDNGDILRAQRYKSSPALLQTLINSVASANGKTTNASQFIDISPWIYDLHILFLADPPKAYAFIEQALIQKETLSSQDKSAILALAIASGKHNELVDELLALFPLETYDHIITSGKTSEIRDVKLLLWADNARVFERYLQIVDSYLKVSPSMDDFSPFPSSSAMTQALFAHYPREFFDRTLRMMRSAVQSERAMGTALLGKTLYWDADFDTSALTRERTAQLKTIVPLIESLASLPEEPMRIALLKHFGVTLPQEPQQRQTTLRQLLSNPNPTVARNALRLLELQTSDYYAEFLWHYPIAGQERLWNAMVADHALAAQDTPLPLRVGL